MPGADTCDSLAHSHLFFLAQSDSGDLFLRAHHVIGRVHFDDWANGGMRRCVVL